MKSIDSSISGELSPTTSQVLSLKYSLDEENWVHNKLHIFDECWKKVPIGEDLVSEFVMFSYDVPLSKSYAPKHLANFNERYRLMMKMHSEFTDLNGNQQEKLWKRNILYGTAMTIVKLESCKNGDEQWNFKYPQELSESWIGNVPLKGGLKKLDMNIINKFSGNNLEIEWKCF